MECSSIFEIMGPVMIGPSSSHTAGAVRLGGVARAIVNEKFKEVTFYLHGSFSDTYKGHGTDKALVAGVIGLSPDDERIKNSLNIARENNLSINFIPMDLGDVHPNTVKMEFVLNSGDTMSITGSSIGGGKIMINKINDDGVKFDCTFPVIIIKHMDVVGIISKIASILAKSNLNIATLRVSRESRSGAALSIVETDSFVSESLLIHLKRISKVISVRFVPSV